MNRRKFIIGTTLTLFAAPAIVRIGNLMPIRVIEPKHQFLIPHDKNIKCLWIRFELNLDGTSTFTRICEKE